MMEADTEVRTASEKAVVASAEKNNKVKERREQRKKSRQNEGKAEDQQYCRFPKRTPVDHIMHAWQRSLAALKLEKMNMPKDWIYGLSLFPF